MENKFLGKQSPDHLIWMLVRIFIFFYLVLTSAETLSTSKPTGIALSHCGHNLCLIRRWSSCPFLPSYFHMAISWEHISHDAITRCPKLTLLTFHPILASGDADCSSGSRTEHPGTRERHPQPDSATQPVWVADHSILPSLAHNQCPLSSPFHLSHQPHLSSQAF